MFRKEKRDFGFMILAWFLFPVFIWGQATGGGQKPGEGGVALGGKVSNPIAKKINSTINKNVFVRLLQKTGKRTSAKQNRNSNRDNQISETKTTLQNSSKPKIAVDRKQVTREMNFLTFEPIGVSGFDRELSDLLTQKADERDALLLIFGETKKAYQAEAKKMNRENDIALATTFFITSCLTVYHQTPEPGNDTTENLYRKIAESMLETPEIGQMSNQSKQLASDKLIYISGLILTGYLSSKESGDSETLQIYRQIAGDCFMSFTGLHADGLRFDDNGLTLIR